MDFHAFLVAPFADYAFMQRALLGGLLIAVSAGPIGVFLMLRRMSLTGDAMAHAILPGAALGFLIFGLDLIPMTLGGLIAGALVAAGAGLVARLTVQKEDAAMAAFYLISLALGVMIVSLRGSSVDLMHVLFGSVLALTQESLLMIAGIAAVSLTTLAIIWRALVAECLDPGFLRSVSGWGPVVHFAFLALVVLNLVAGFQALGTLLSVGLMILPAAAARFWVRRVLSLCLLAIGIGAGSVLIGLLISFHAAIASGPAVILAAGAVYFASLLIAPRGLVRVHLPSKRHKVA
ncbi:MAG: zinc ABC transporter permease AztB [Hyphomicrobiales bacterium]|jgi:zinc/manganese transport system permease protein